MDDSRIPKRFFHGEIRRGKRRVGRPLLRFSDSVKRDLHQCNITNWEEGAQDRGLWRRKVREGGSTCEGRWRTREEERRADRHGRRAQHGQ